MNRQYSRVTIQAYGSYSHQSMKNSDLPQYQIQQSRSTPTSLGMGKTGYHELCCIQSR